jgi:hypothetical protein
MADGQRTDILKRDLQNTNKRAKSGRAIANFSYLNNGTTVVA